MTEPGAQAAFIYALLILLAGMVLKYIVFNGMIKRFFDLEELKIKELQTLNKKVIDIEGEIREDHRALKDIFGLLYAQRESDKR